MASKSPKSRKIKINRDTSKLILGSSKKTEDLETVKSESKERTKRHHGESSSGNSNKIQKLMKLYEEDASNAATLKGQGSNASQLEGFAPLRTTHVLANIEAEPPNPDVKMTKKDSKSTTLLKKEPSKADPHFKALPLGKKMESDGDVAEKKGVPMLGEKKTIKINIQTKLLALPQKSEKVIEKESDSDSRSSSDGDDSSDSDDENWIADGLPWRTILEDGELSPSSDEAEEEGEEEGRGGEKDVKETSENLDKTIEEKETEVLERKGKDKRSSKHKHKSKHKKHKHKKSKKKKSKHKRKDKQEKESSCVKNADHGAKGGVEVDVEQKGEKASSSKKRSKEEKQKESMQDSKEKKGRSSSSSSRRTSEEREAKGIKQDETLKDVQKNISSKSSERKEKSRSHHGSRSSSKEKHAKDAIEVFKKSEPDLSVETGRRKHDIDKKEKADSKHERGSKSNEKITNRESQKEIEKIEVDVKSVHLSKEIERSIKVTELKRIELEEKCRNVTGSNIKAKEEMLHAKTNSRKSDSKEETGTEQAGPSPSHADGSISITLSSIKDTAKTQKDGKSNSSHKTDKQRHHESKSKEESRQKEDSKNRHKTEEGKKDSKHDESSSKDRRKDDKRHKEKKKDKEDKKRHSRKNQVATKVKIDHLEHDFPSAEEYADVSGSMDSAEKKDDVKTDTSTPGESELSEIKSRIGKPVEVVLLKEDEVEAENTDKSKERVIEGKGHMDSPNEQVHVTTENNIAVVSDSEKKTPLAEKCGVVQDRLILAKDAAKRPSEEKDIADSPTPDKNLDSAESQVENISIAKPKTSDIDKSNKEGKTSENSEHVGSVDKKDVSSKIGKKEKRADSTSSSTEKTEKSNESKSGEKEMVAKDVKKETDRTSKKRKKEKADDKEEGAVDSEIEEGEIVKKHKKSKKKDKKKDKSEKDRSDRDKSEHRERRRSRYSDSRSESRSHSRSHKRHKGSRSKSRSDDGSDSDISIGKPKMVEKSYFSESRGCWVTRMVPKEDESSSDPDDGDEPYDIGDTFIRHPAHDRRSVFDRLGSGSSSRRGHFNDRFERHSRYGYSRRRGRSYSRSRSRSRSRSPKFKIDKKKLLEIAKANALQRMRAGELPANLPIPESIKKAADSYEVNESIQKFTERCKALANLQGGSSDDDSPVNRPVGSDEEDGDESQKPFVRHPFKVKEAAPIVLNIKNAVQIPVGGKDTLRVQFPVSSGSQHRKKEEEIIIANANDPYGQWTAVEKPEPKPEPKPPAAPTTKVSTTTAPQPPTPATGPAATPATAPATQTTPATTATPTSVASAAAAAPAGPYIPGVTNIQPPKPVAEEDRVFEDAPGFSYDIGQIVSARLKAARALQSNPNNVEALTVLHHSQKQIRTWAHSSKKPGLFTGSTDATFLRPEQLSNPNRKNQAWIKKDMFLTAAPVNTDIGRSLMHKMGWKQGEGLGKNKEGALNPLLLEIKTDRQGLVAAAEKPKKKGDVSKVIRKDLSGKHPVMALNELCNKKRWGKPNFEVVREDGPAHRKNFVFKVRIRNEEYIPTVPSANKKDAKALAATVALQKMGLLMS